MKDANRLSQKKKKDYKGSLYVSGRLPTYPSPKPTFCPKGEESVNVGLGEGQVGSFPETYNDPHKEGTEQAEIKL